MKRLVLAAIWAVWIATPALAQPSEAPQPAAAPAAAPVKPAEAFKTDEQRTFYALGVWLSQQVGVFNLTAAELKFVQLGLKDAVLGSKPQVDLKEYGPKIQALAQSRIKAKSDKEKRKAKEFISQAAKEPGAQSFPSGLVYKEVKAGSGPSPKEGDIVKAHYHGTLADGTVFDSSVQRGQPLEFPLSGVIKCWQEGIPKMKVGGKAKFVCPSDIAYGDQGNGKIPPGAALAFDVELIEIVKK